MVDLARQAGVLTPEMIEAGAEILNIQAEGCFGALRSEQVAETVFWAMWNARSQSSTPSHSRGAPESRTPQQSA